jgi:hypothetical protein
MRSEFRDIVSGWLLTNDFDALTEIIERAAEWTKSNGPLLPKEQAIVMMMIERQIAFGLEVYPMILSDGRRIRIADLNRN